MKDNVAIVIVNWNGYQMTADCLRSLATLEKKDINLRIVVVDNGSSDNSVTKLQEEFPSITVKSLDKNLGFTGGNNAGITEALAHGADFIWLLNNDTTVDPKALAFLQTFDDASVGVVGSKIYFSKGREYHASRYKPNQKGRVLWYAGGNIDWANMYASHRGVDEVDDGQYDTAEQTAFVTGCSMIIRKDVIDRVGMFDDAYYLYLEDVDFCLRAQKAGFRLVYDPRSIVWHKNAGSSGKPGGELHNYYLTRNRLLLGIRFAPLRTKVALVREAIAVFLHEKGERRKAVLDAFLGNLGKQYEPKINNN